MEKKTLLGPNLTKGQVWTNTGVVVVNAAVFASLYRVRFSLGEQGSASPHLRTWAGLSGAVIGFDQLLFPRVPLRYALPRRAMAAAAERDAGPFDQCPESKSAAPLAATDCPG